MKHWWNVSGTSPSGLKHNYVWHLRQMLYALIPPTVALLTLEACSRWQKKRSAAALHKELPENDGSNIASRHQKAKPIPQQSSPETVINSPDKQPANRWTTASSWWKDPMMKLKNIFTQQREVSNQPTTSPTPDETTPAVGTTKQPKVDQTLPQMEKDSGTIIDPAILARLNAMESELSLLRQQVTRTDNSPSPQPQLPIPTVAAADDPIDTTQSTIGLRHPQHAGPLMWTSLSFLLILCRLRSSQAKFEPYVDNGGTVVGITGRNYAIIASDTRLSESYVIRSRNISKIFEVADGVYLAASGCLSDTIALSKVMQSEMKMYEWQNERKPTVSILAHCLANVLYSRRNFPYFSVCAIAGLDATGRGALYRYDALGSFERVRAVCAGKGERLIQPLLDEITDMEEDETLFIFPGQLMPSMLPIPTSDPTTTTTDTGGRGNIIRGKELDVEEACELIVTAFKAAAEREISIGDGIDVCIIRTVSPHGQESLSIASGDTMIVSETDDQLMNEKIVAQTVDQRIDGTTKTVVNQRTRSRTGVSIERRTFSLPRH